MPNTSATGGYLTPAGSPAPLYGAALYAFLQPIIVGISGLPGTSVYPRWQIDPENLPAVGTDWAAFGITFAPNRKFAFVQHYPTVGITPGYDQYQTHEEMNILCSFYGPDADTYAALFRDGLYIGQNREPLQLAGMNMVDTGDIVTAAILTKGRWLHRFDLRWTVRRIIVRNYPILDVLSAVGTLIFDDQPPYPTGTLTEQITVTGP